MPLLVDPVFNRRLTFRRRWKHVIFLLLRIFVLPTLRVVMRFKIYGEQNIPKRGGALIIGNHVHNADPILMLSASTRPILWMAKIETWQMPVLRWFASQAGAFPVDRGRPDRAAIRTAVSTVREGLLVGMYPEGTRSTTGGLKEPFPGAAVVAVQAKAPIIPCVILGSDDLPLNGDKQRPSRRRYPKVHVVFGEPFRLESRDPSGKRHRAEELTDAMMIEIARMLPPGMRGIYRDCADVPHPAVRRGDIQFLGAD